VKLLEHGAEVAFLHIRVAVHENYKMIPCIQSLIDCLSKVSEESVSGADGPIDRVEICVLLGVDCVRALRRVGSVSNKDS
jgi:hypothetical protein